MGIITFIKNKAKVIPLEDLKAGESFYCKDDNVCGVIDTYNRAIPGHISCILFYENGKIASTNWCIATLVQKIKSSKHEFTL